MKRKGLVIRGIVPTVLVLCVILVWPAAPLGARLGLESGRVHGRCPNAEPPSGCTVFTVAMGGQVFFGGNDNCVNPDSYYWVDPGTADGYGAIWIGTPDNVQQGVNEMGLAYDANVLPRFDVNPHPERTPVAGGYTSCPIHILRECARVEEVIDWVNTHRWHSFMHDQMQVADASGDAVIISAGADGEVVFTRKPQGDGYLVSTSFDVAKPANGYGYPCWRYQTAQRMLRELVERDEEPTAQDAANALDVVHVAGGPGWTIESLVADLPNGIVYLYYLHQFHRPPVLNVADEIASGRPGGPLSLLFPEGVRQEAARRYERFRAQNDACPVWGKAWLGVDLGSLLLLLPRRSESARAGSCGYRSWSSWGRWACWSGWLPGARSGPAPGGRRCWRRRAV